MPDLTPNPSSTPEFSSIKKMPEFKPGPTSFEKSYDALAAHLPLATKVHAEQNNDLPGVTVRHFKQQGSKDDIAWMKISISKDEAHNYFKFILQLEHVEGLLRNDGLVLVRLYRDHNEMRGLPRAITPEEAGADVTKILLRGVENVLLHARNGNLKPEIIVTATRPSAEEQARMDQIAREISEEVAKERIYGERGPHIRLTPKFRQKDSGDDDKRAA